MDTIKVFAFKYHRYEDMARKQTYQIDAGEFRELPEDVAMYILEAHPDKLKMIESEEDYNQCLEDYLGVEELLEKEEMDDEKISDPDKGVRYSPQKRKIRRESTKRSRHAREEVFGDH